MAKKNKKQKKKKVMTIISPHPPIGNEQLQGPGFKYPISKDPAWMRLTIIVLYLTTIIWLAYIVKGVLATVLTSGLAIHGISQIVKLIKGKDP